HGLPTREYVAVVFARDKKRWTENSRYVRLYVPPQPPVATASANGAPSIATTPQRPDSIAGLPPGEYYVAVVDDLPSEGARDAAQRPPGTPHGRRAPRAPARPGATGIGRSARRDGSVRARIVARHHTIAADGTRRRASWRAVASSLCSAAATVTTSRQTAQSP